MPEQYATDANLQARQRLWQVSPRDPPFSLHSWVVGLARLQGDETVLEVGCGNGFYLELIDAVGLDRSVGMLQAARARTAGPLVAGDATDLPFASNAFDVVLVPHMLYHVDDRPAAVAEIRRVLRPFGICIVVTNSERDQLELVRVVEEAAGHGWRWRRPAAVAFSLENGREQLRTGFTHVDRIPCPSGVVKVTDVEAVADYLRSVGDVFEDEIEGSWEDLVRRCTERVTQVMAAEGVFTITPSVGAFLCR
jgi:SAM-dependent methyltransferase